ncbi:reverse transcriptase [Artemisia annua]|uniref:Reverse transcriptase n=1 Tax=Artemisia annua TaxID=35608 RepID=A0A2U1NDW9_ARTAN|nr:reverse transcriptase [Artemisia annua]
MADIEEALKEVCSEDPLDKINTNNQLVSIKLKDPLAEINIPNRIPYSIKDVKEFKEECQQLLSNGIIRESSSPHLAPAFYVENKDEVKRGKRRMDSDQLFRSKASTDASAIQKTSFNR